MFKKISILSLIMLFLFTSCTNVTQDNNNSNIKIIVSFNAMKEFAQIIGGDKVEIITMIPDGIEPHDFEPKAKDLSALNNANIFIYNGLDFEHWAEKIDTTKNKDLIIVQASEGIEPISVTENEDSENYDPHVWLSLKNAQIECENIKNALVLVDPANEEYYNNNYNEFVLSTTNLFNEYDTKFKNAQNKNFVTGHAAFGYLCKEFGLTQNSVEDVYAEGEPSAKQLSDLILYCKENNVTTIFAEELASPEISETLANEIGGKVETIYTIESADGDLTYLDRMKYNLEKINESLNN